MGQQNLVYPIGLTSFLSSLDKGAVKQVKRPLAQVSRTGDRTTVHRVVNSFGGHGVVFARWWLWRQVQVWLGWLLTCCARGGLGAAAAQSLLLR